MPILTAVDGDSIPSRTTRLAHGLARELDEDLVVLHVMSRDLFGKLRDAGEADRSTALSLLAPKATYGVAVEPPESSPSADAYSIERAEEDAARVARTVVDETVDDPGDVTAVGRVGDPDEEIVAEANRRDARYLIVGGRKRTPVGKAVFGSVTQSVLLNAERPVLTVPRGQTEVATDGPVLAAVDRSDRAARVVEEGWRLAVGSGRDLHVVHVLSRDEFRSLDRDDVPESGRDASDADVTSVGERMASELAEDVADDYTAVGLVGEPPSQIVDYAEEIDASFIVTSGRKRSPVGKVLFGSVTQSIMLTSDRPVLATMGEE